MTPDVKVVTSRAILKETLIMIVGIRVIIWMMTMMPLDGFATTTMRMMMMTMLVMMMKMMVMVNLVERLIRKGKDETPSLLSAFTMPVT